MKKLLFFILVSFAFCNAHAQTIYFKLKDTESKAQKLNDKAVFSQGAIQTALGSLVAKPVLKHPEKFHSIYADRLARTYSISLSELSVGDKDNLKHQLEGISSIEYVEIEEKPLLASCPTNDPSDAAWNLSRHEITCVQEAHCITTGDPAIIIAARDNGFIAGHPEHAGQVVYAEPGAYNGACHGTQTSITSAGATDNGFGISASGYDCSLALYHWNGFVGDYEDMLLRGVRVAHNSYTNFDACSGFESHQNIINLVTEQGLIVVGSAGNGNGGANCNISEPTFPSAHENVISVSSVSSSLCCETTYNFWDPAGYDPPLQHSHNETVDLLAQGYAVVTGSCEGGGQAMGYGTSIAGPHVAGIIGLMLSVNPCLNHDDVLSILQSTGQDVTSVCNNSSYYPNGAPPVPCAESAVLAAQSYIGPDLVINSDTDWDQRFVSGNVIIREGATLTIHGIASMAANSKIIVEKNADLIIDGGIITSCHDEWKGIVVEGNGASNSQSLAGKVTLLNNAIIENARTAISMDPTHLGWPAVSQHWGGLVEADNSTFRNCRRAVAFMKYGTGFIEDQSYFKNCNFENIETTAVTIWSNNNVTFEGCTFDGIKNRGIYAYDSEVIVKDQCTFSNQPTGVDIITTYPIPFAPLIGLEGTLANDFQCSKYGVFAQAMGNSKALEIKNNNFLGGLYGVHINGLSSYEIVGNDMLGSYTGVEPISTGSGTHTNIITNNNISSMTYGSHAVHDNANLEYLDNCFGSNSTADVYVNSGAIFVEQGSLPEANGNCFTKGGVPEIDNSQNDTIKLWVWENEPSNSCEFPTVNFNDDSYKVKVDIEATGKVSSPCGSMSSPGIINVRTFCSGPFKTKQQILDKIAEIQSAIINIENDSSLSQVYKDYLLRIYKRCLHKLQVQIMVVILLPESEDADGIGHDGQRIEAAINYASSLPLFEQQILAYGLMVNTGQLTRARQYINGIASTSTSETNFVWAQNINLDYLSDVQNYVLSPQAESTLFAIGKGIAPLDGYARSIYEVITGTRVMMDIPNPHNTIRPRSSKNSSDVVEYSIYPNPSTGQTLTLSIEGLPKFEGFSLSIIDIYGKMMLSERINSAQHVINTSEFANGTYVITVVNSKGEVEHVEKVIVIQ